jgi:Protein of unknown function (DUF998)
MQLVTKSAPMTGTQRLALLSCLGVALYLVIDVILFFLRPDLPIVARAESDYGNGPWSWLMDLNFLLRCALSLAALLAFWSALPRAPLNRIGLVLLGVWAVGSGLLAFFPDNPVGTPLTVHGTIHILLAVIAFFCCWFATLFLTIVLARRWRRHPVVIGLILCWVMAAVGMVLVSSQGPAPGPFYGLDERIFLGFELLWIALALVPLAWSKQPAV